MFHVASTQGAAIRLNELQTTIEIPPAFAEQLEKISRNRLILALQVTQLRRST